MLEPVIGTELLELASIPITPFDGSDPDLFTRGFVSHPDRKEFYSYIDVLNLTFYIRIGETMYKTPMVHGGCKAAIQEAYRLYDLHS